MPKTTQITGSKKCMVCSKMKPIEEYYVRDKKTLRRHSECKECTKIRVNKRRYENPMGWREPWLRRTYNIGQADYDQMLVEQKYCCAICGTSDPKNGRSRSKAKYFDIDHDHKTGKVRGLLCKSCNTAIGQMQESPAILRKAIAYLDDYME